MGSVESNLARPSGLPEADSLFERCSWFYAMCREYLFRDHTPEISRALFPDEPVQGTNVLELGCGPGFYACRLAQLYPQITATGLDLSTRLIERARSRAASRSLANCMFRQGDATSLPDLPSPVDAVIISRLFLIVPNKRAVLSEVHRVLRPGGRCFIAEPTSGFRTRVPLSCMWMLARLSSSPAGKYREPQQADVMSHASFSDLVRSQPWASVEVRYDGWYQYAVCEKAAASDSARSANSSMPYPILDPAHPDPSRRLQCALAVMAKAPRPGKVKTRLCPPLTPEQSAALNICFLKDTTENIDAVSTSDLSAGLISYTPAGDEALFEGILPQGFSLVLQRGDGFGERLLAAATDILACGFGAVCLIDSDSPTVPAAAFEQAIAELARPGDRIVLGGSNDGGYYLIGLKQPHPELFTNISWSTSTVYAETIAAAEASGLEVVLLPLWYDVDDGATLEILTAELLEDLSPPFATQAGYPAPHSREFLLQHTAVPAE